MVEQIRELSDIFAQGGPYAVTAVFFLLFLWERHKNDKKDKVILSLALQNERGRRKVVEALAPIKEVLREVHAKVNQTNQEEPQ